MKDQKKTKRQLIEELERLRTEINVREQAEKASIESEGRYRGLVNNVGTGICVIQDEKFQFVNQQLAKTTGYAEEELLGMPFLDLIHPDDRKLLREQFSRRISGLEPTVHYHYRGITKDRGIVWIEVFGALIDYQGNPAILANIIDITERKRVEETVVRERNLSNVMIDNVAGIFYLFDQEGRFLRWNKSFEAVTGYSTEEMSRLHPLDLFQGPDRELLAGRIQMTFESGRADVEAVLVAKNGLTTPYHFTGRRIELDGRPCLIGTGIDITERRKAAEALRKSEELYRTVVESSPTGVYVRREDKFLFVNKQVVEMTGYSLEELMTMSLFDLVHPEDRERAIQEAMRSASEQQPEEYGEYRIVARSGEIFWIESTTGIHIDYEGEPAILARVINITERKRSEEALRESESLYRLLADNVTDLIWTFDIRSLRFTYVSPSVKAIHGYTADEAMKWRLEDILTPTSLEIMTKEFGGALAPENVEREGPAWSRTLELELYRKDDSIFWGEITVTFLPGPDGQPKELLGITRDITERRQAKQILEESLSILNATLESTADGILVTDVEGNIQKYNRKFLEMWGIPEPISKSDESYEIRRQMLNQIKNLEETLQVAEEAYDSPDKEGFSVVELKNGKAFETYWYPQKIEGRTVGAVTSMRDVTEGRNAAEALRESEERYRTLFEESKDVVFISTPEGRFLDINPAGIDFFGYSSKGEFLEAVMVQDTYVNPEDRDLFRATIERQGFVRDYKVTLKRKDGKRLDAIITANTVRDSAGNIVAYRGIIRDITEQKRLQQQFYQSQKMESIGTLAGGIAHDFNNLLGGILGYASLMKTKMTIDNPFYNYIDTIEGAAIRASDLTSQLLSFARGGKYEVEPINLNRIMEETLNIISRTFDKEIEIETFPYDSLPTVEADAGQIQQVLMNLCVNAADSMPAGGKLILETDISVITEEYVKTHIGATPGSYVALSVTDTGIGIDRETVQRIFEPFFTTKEKGKGTGLGLAMVYGVVKNHGGHVQVYSEPGHGTTFKIYLPVSGKSELEKAQDIESPLGRNELILVVDDEKLIRSLAKEILEVAGYRVLLAEDGEEAVRIYYEYQNAIDMVIIDMVMPKMGGARGIFED